MFEALPSLKKCLITNTLVYEKLFSFFLVIFANINCSREYLFLKRKSMIMYWRKTTYLFPNFFIWLFNCVIIKSYYLKWFVVQNLCLCLLQLIKMKGYCSIWFGKTVFNHLKWVSKIILLQNLVSNNQLRMMIMEWLL